MTTDAVTLSFFIPCLNEQGNVGRAIDRIVSVMADAPASYEIVVVDDASVDGSIDEVLGRRRRYPSVRIELIRNRFTRGLGRNYFIAAQRARGEYFLLTNGDAAEPEETLRTIVSHVGEADAIVPYFGLHESRTFPRRMLSWTFTYLVNLLGGHHLKYYNGPVLHRTENVRVWFAETAGFGYQAELLCRLLDEGISVKEVQVANSNRQSGFSKAFTLSNVLSVANTLFHIFLRRLERLAFRLLSPRSSKPASGLGFASGSSRDIAGRFPMTWEPVQAWAGSKTTHSWLARPSSIDECAGVIELAQRQELTICPRGAGYSYADVILNDGQILLDTSRMDRILRWEASHGQMIAEPGVTVREVLRTALGSGWSLPACVGGMGVTLAGAVSNNVHGKDSWKVGSFGDHVLALKLLTAKGEILTVTRSDSPELFRAVIGGLGLLGVIVEVTVQLQRVPSPFVEVVTTPIREVREWVEVFEHAEGRWDFLVAWVDAFAQGAQLGRGTVTTARWIETSRRVSERQLAESLTMPTRVFGVLPARATWAAVRPFYGPRLVRMANAARYRAFQRRGRYRQVMLVTDFLFLHKKIPNINQVYRPHGLVEFQPLIPRRAGVAAIEALFRLCQREQTQSLLCGVKRHRSDDYLLSYSGEGYSIGVDITRRGRTAEAMTRFARTLSGMVSDWGGKLYLAKDEWLPRDIFEQMYPQARVFLQVKSRLDSEGRFASDLYRRLLSSREQDREAPVVLGDAQVAVSAVSRPSGLTSLERGEA